MNNQLRKLIDACKALERSNTRKTIEYYESKIDRLKTYLEYPHLTPMGGGQVLNCIAYASSRIAELTKQ